MQQTVDSVKVAFYQHFNKHLPQPTIYDLSKMFNLVTFEWDFSNGFEINLEVNLYNGIGNLNVLNHKTNDFTTFEMDMTNAKAWEKLNLEVEWNAL